MQELTFEQVEVVSGGFQGLTGPEDLFRQIISTFIFDSNNGSNFGPINQCKGRLGALKCMAETGGILATFNEIVDFVSTNGPKAWEAFVEYAEERATRINEKGGPRKRL